MDEEEIVEETESSDEVEETTAPDYANDFADLRESISGLATMLEGIRDSIALFVSDGGATVREDSDDDEKTITVEDIPGVDDLDLTI